MGKNNFDVDYALQWGHLFPNDERVQEIVQEAQKRRFLENRQRQNVSAQYRADNPWETSTLENAGTSLFALGMGAKALATVAPITAPVALPFSFGAQGLGMLEEFSGNPISNAYRKLAGLDTPPENPDAAFWNKAMLLGIPTAGALAPKAGAWAASKWGVPALLEAGKAVEPALAAGLGAHGLREMTKDAPNFGEGLASALFEQPVPTLLNAGMLAHGSAGLPKPAMRGSFGLMEQAMGKPGLTQEVVPNSFKDIWGAAEFLPLARYDPRVTVEPGFADKGTAPSMAQEFKGPMVDEMLGAAQERGRQQDAGVAPVGPTDSFAPYNPDEPIYGFRNPGEVVSSPLPFVGPEKLQRTKIYINEGSINKAWLERKPINLSNETEPVDPKLYPNKAAFREVVRQHEINHVLGEADEAMATKTKIPESRLQEMDKVVSGIHERIKQSQKGWQDIEARPAIKPRPEPVVDREPFKPATEEQLNPPFTEGMVPTNMAVTGRELQPEPVSSYPFKYSADEKGNIVARENLPSTDTSRLGEMFFAKETKEPKKQEQGFLSKIVGAPKAMIDSFFEGASKEVLQPLLGKASENTLGDIDAHLKKISPTRLFDGKTADQEFNDLKRLFFTNIAGEVELKKDFEPIEKLMENLDFNRAESDLLTNGALWFRGVIPAKTPEGREMQARIQELAVKYGKGEGYRFTGEGDYARQMLKTNEMDKAVLGVLDGLSPEAKKGFVASFRNQDKLSPVEQAALKTFQSEIEDMPGKAAKIAEVENVFENLRSRAWAAITNPEVIANDPNAAEFAGLSDVAFGGKMRQQTADLVHSIFLKQMEPGERLKLEKDFKPGIVKRRSFFFSPEDLEQDGRALISSWMSQHQLLHKAPVYNELTKFFVDGPGAGMEGSQQVLKHIQQETMPQVKQGEPSKVSNLLDYLFGWETKKAISPNTEAAMKTASTLYQQFLGTLRFGTLNSMDAFIKSAMLLAEKGVKPGDAWEVGEIVGKAIIGDKNQKKLIDDFFVTSEPGSYGFSRAANLPRRGDKGLIPGLAQRIPGLYEGYSMLRKGQNEIIRRSENFSDKVAFLTNLHLEMNKRGKKLMDIYKMPEEAQKEMIGRVMDDTMKLQNKYAGVLNKTRFGYETQGAYGSPQYIAMMLAGMFAKYPANFMNELIKRQALSGRTFTGPMLAFILAQGGTFGTYSILTSKEQTDMMGKARKIFKAVIKPATQIKPAAVPMGLISDVLSGNWKGMANVIIPGLPGIRGALDNIIGGKR